MSDRLRKVLERKRQSRSSVTEVDTVESRITPPALDTAARQEAAQERDEHLEEGKDRRTQSGQRSLEDDGNKLTQEQVVAG